MGKVIGIDLGTTNTAIAVLDGGRPRVLEDDKGYKVLPSCVSMKADGKFVVGQSARQMTLTHPDRTVYAIKRLMGRRFDSPEVQTIKQHVQYQIEPAPDGGCLVNLGGQLYSPVEISAVVLQVARTLAEAALHDTVDEAVITVPAYFNHAQRAATFEAARLAGLRCERLVNEPTAAALAFGFRRDIDRTVLIFDLGGGTFDVSVLHLTRGVYEILASRGDTYLGGEDIDYRLVEHLAKSFQASNGVDLRKDRGAVQRLKEAAERAKCELSFTDKTVVLIPHVSGSMNLEIALTRLTLEGLVEDLIERTLEVTRRAVADAGLKLSDVEDVVLVGGQTRMPRLREAVGGLFRKEPSRTVHPEEAVAIGAAVHASSLTDAEVGAPLLLDVTPFDLGIDVAGGIFQAMINRNAHVPTSHSKVFATVHDNQDSVRVTVRQGTGRMSAENEFLGEFVLAGLTPAPSMQTKVEVTFRIDTNGMLHVSAIEPATGESKRITVRNYAEVATGGARDNIKLEGDVHQRATASGGGSGDKVGATPKVKKSRMPGALAGLFGRVTGRGTAERAPGTVTPTIVPESNTLLPPESDAEPEALEPSAMEAVEPDPEPLMELAPDALQPVPEQRGQDLRTRSPNVDDGAGRIVLPDILPPLSALGQDESFDVVSVIGPASTIAERSPARFGLAGESPSWEYAAQGGMDRENRLPAPSRFDPTPEPASARQAPHLGANDIEPVGGPKDASRSLGFDLPDLDDPGLSDLGDLDDLYPDIDEIEVVPPKPPPPKKSAARTGNEPRTLDRAPPERLPLPTMPEVPPKGPHKAPLTPAENYDLFSATDSDLVSRTSSAHRPAEGPVAPALGSLAGGQQVDDLLSLAEELFAGLGGPEKPAASAPDNAEKPKARSGDPASRWAPGPTTLLGPPRAGQPQGTGPTIRGPQPKVTPAAPAAAAPAKSAPATPAAAAPAAAAPAAPAAAPARAGERVRRPARLKLAYPRIEALRAELRENLARNNCFVKTDRPLPVGRDCVVEMSGPGLASPIELSGIVRHVLDRKDPSSGQGPGMEIEYSLSAEQRTVVQRFAEG